MASFPGSGEALCVGDGSWPPGKPPFPLQGKQCPRRSLCPMSLRAAPPSMWEVACPSAGMERQGRCGGQAASQRWPSCSGQRPHRPTHGVRRAAAWPAPPNTVKSTASKHRVSREPATVREPHGPASGHEKRLLPSALGGNFPPGPPKMEPEAGDEVGMCALPWALLNTRHPKRPLETQVDEPLGPATSTARDPTTAWGLCSRAGRSPAPHPRMLNNMKESIGT